MELEESKKRQNEDTTPISQRRQQKKTREEDTDEAHPRRVLFPAEASSSYVTFYSKEHQRGKEPRWKQQLASIKTRSMQASTPQTAKKPSSSPAEVEQISTSHLELQIQQAKQTMEKMQQTMTNPEQPPYIQEMQQQMMNQSLTKRPGNGETNHRPQAQHTRCGHPNAARA